MIIKKARTAAKILKWTVEAFWYDFERHYFAQFIPRKPRVINFLANDICNSRCTMCMIWKQKRDKELSPDEIRQVLSDPLFSQVRGIGVTGGEPTLRKDLPEIFEAIVTTLPRVQTVSTITNAIREKDVIDRIERSIAIAHEHGKQFHVMVSLDGVGEVHDRNRGRAGNFESAVQVLHHFRDHPIASVSIGCTITKYNVWDVDNVLEFAQSEGVYARFRVAEFINRLYNEDETEAIRNFNVDELYHLSRFFDRLIADYETHPTIIRTYRSIRRMLSGEAGRTIGCPYQSRGIVMDCRGQLQYCAPKSNVIGNALEMSAQKIFNRNLGERRRIIRENCRDCIHDYHSVITISELADIYRPLFWKGTLNLGTGKVAARIIR